MTDLTLPTGNSPRRRRPRMRRVPGAEPLRLTPSHRRMLELLALYRYLTASLVGQLYSRGGRGEKHVANELGRLYHHGYLSRHLHRTALPGEGSEAFIYTLAPDGARAVLAPAEWRAARHLIYARGQAKHNLDHLFAIAVLHVLLSTASVAWQIEEFISDHEDQSRQLQAEVPGLGRRTIWPDGEALVRRPDGRRVLVLFEVDRTRRANRRVDERFQAYAALLAGVSGARLRQERGADHIEVLFIEPTEAEQKRMTIRAFELCAAKTIPPPLPPFRFWSTGGWWSEGRLRNATDVLSAPTILTLRGTREPFIAASAETNKPPTGHAK